MIRAGLLLALWLPLVALAQAAQEPALAEVSAQLERPAVVRGEFEQAKQIAGLSRPLVSRGRFVVASGQGVLWDTLEPFPQQLRISAAGVRAAGPDEGSQQTLVGGDAGSAARELNRVLGAVFEADLEVLGGYFRVQCEPVDGAWRLRLEPRAAALARVFSGITLQGDRLVESIELREANGDTTRIRFASTVTGSELTQAERDALAP